MIATTSGSGRLFHKQRGVRFESARRDDSSRCGSTWLERADRDRETGGSNPLTSTSWRDRWGGGGSYKAA